MTRASLAALLGVLALLPGTRVLRAFDLLDGVRWGVDPLFLVNPNFPSSAGSPAAQEETLVCAAAAWTDQTSARFQFRYGGLTSAAGFFLDDGINAVSWTNEDGFDALAAALVDTNARGQLSFDIVFFGTNFGIPVLWTGPGLPNAGSFDVLGVAMHEFGHALGLDHSEFEDATMFAFTSPGEFGLRLLHPDDRAGAESLYGRRPGGEPSVVIDQVSPNSGEVDGGGPVLIEGTNFTWSDDTRLEIGGLVVSRTRYDVERCTRLRIHSMPPGDPGSVDIAIENSLGRTTLAEAYTYLTPEPGIRSIEPERGPLWGGTELIVRGVGLDENAVITVGAQELIDARFVDSRTIAGILPPGESEGAVDVRLAQRDFTSVLASAFHYVADIVDIEWVRSPLRDAEFDVAVRVSSPAPLALAAVAVEFDATRLRLERYSTAGTPGAGGRLVLADSRPAAGIFGVALAFEDPAARFPAGMNVPLARLTFRPTALAAPGDVAPIRLRDTTGAQAIRIRLERDDGTTRFPLLIDGGIDFVAGLPFLRGDTNGDRGLNLSDAVFTLNHLFLSGPPPSPCADAADTNDDGTLNLSDAVFLLNYLFQNGPQPAAPFPVPGVDPTADVLDCAQA